VTDHHETGTGWPDRPPVEPLDAPLDAPVEPTGAPTEVPPVDASVEPIDAPTYAPPVDSAVDAPVPAPVDSPVDELPPSDEPDPDVATAEAEVEEVAPAATGTSSRRQRISAAGAVIGVLLLLFGFALVVQLRTNSSDEQLSTARPEDLVRILSDLDARKDRLSEEISQLQTTQQQLTAGSQGRAAALDAAAKRARDLGILAGTLAAQGPGIQVDFVAGAQGLKGTAALILDAVQELRDAGAEAMEIDGSDGTAVRIVASSWFLDAAAGALEVDGRTLTGAYRLTAIGDPQTMRTALNIPGGVVDRVHNAGGNVIVNEPGTVRVTALHQTAAPRYARPAG
jgi:uncharacterized protein YlxW (UPF0749 family)